MTWIVDIEPLGVLEAEPPDALEIAFDVIFPGETWCRCVVLVGRDFSYRSEHELVSTARDEVVRVIEREGRPVAVRLRLCSSGVEVQAVAAPGG